MLTSQGLQASSQANGASEVHSEEDHEPAHKKARIDAGNGCNAEIDKAVESNM